MKYGVLGLGSIGTRHTQNLIALGHEVIAFDPCKDRREFFTSEGLNLAASRDIVLENSEAIVVASPNVCHFDDMKAAIEAGRHVFVEKPLTHTVKGITPILAEASNKKLVVFAGLNLRYHPAVIESKRIISEELLGNLHWARSLACFYLPEWRPEQDYRVGYVSDPKTGGVMFDVIHEIDLVSFLLGKPDILAAVARSSGYLEIPSDDVADIILRHPQGVVTSLHMNLFTRFSRRITEVSGEKGVLTIDLKERSLLVQDNLGKEIFNSTYESTWDDDYKEEISIFQSIIDGADYPYCDGFEALEILRVVIEARKLAGLPS